MTVTRYYKVNGEFHTYDWLHDNLGYTKTATTSVTYKDATYAGWGQDTSATGYFDSDGPFYDLENHIFFVVNEVGWHSLNQLAVLGYYPSSSSPLQVKKGNVVSDAVCYEWDAAFRYLIREVISDGWMSYEEMIDDGWEIYNYQGEPIGGDISSTTDNIIYADWGPGTVERGGYAYPDGNLLGMQWNFGGEVEEYDTRPNIEINLGIRWNPPTNTEWLAKTFPANDYWWAGILSDEDLAALQAFGCGYLQTTNPTVAWPGLIGALKFEGEKYDYKMIRMFTGVGEGSIPFDHSNFYLSRDYSSGAPTQYDGCALINSINAFDVAVKTYRVRISDKDPGAIYVLCGFNLSGGSWAAVTFSGNGSYWWAGLIYADDQAKLQALGLISDTSYPYDEILYSALYEYECVAMYSDMGITPVSFNANDFYVTKSTDYPAIAIFSNTAFLTPVKTWVCRIKRKDYTELTLYSYQNENSSTLSSFQTSITSNSTTGDINGGNVGPLRTESSGGGSTVAYDSAKLYEVGRYIDGVWQAYPIQSLSEFPSSTTSDFYSRTTGYLLVNRGGYLSIWLATNYTSPLTTSTTKWVIRAYDKPYTERTVYRIRTFNGSFGPDYYYQNSVTNAFAGYPENWYKGWPLVANDISAAEIPWDSSKHYELGEYVDGVWTPYSIQSIGDMPSTTTSTMQDAVRGYLIINANDEVVIWFVTNYTRFDMTTTKREFVLRTYG